MDMEKFLRELFEAGRFKTSLNLMDRKIFINVGPVTIPVESIEIDYKGDVVLNVDEGIWREITESTESA